MKFVNRLVIIAGAILAPLLVAAPAQTEQISVTHWGSLMYGAPFAVAIEKGFYKDAGLDIDGILTSKGGGTTVRNVMASDLPYGEVALSAVIAAVKQGIDLKIIHNGVRTAGEILWVARPDSDIASVKDLAGKKVAITSPKSVTDMLLIMVCDKYGIKTQAVAAGGISSGLTMVEQKAAVAAPVMDPIWSKVRNRFKPVFHVRDELPMMVQTVGVATTAFAAANRDKLRKLVQVRKKAVEYLYAHPEETAKIVAKQYGIDEALSLSAIKNLIALKYWSSGEFEYPAMDNMVRGLQIIGEVEGKIDWSKLVDETFVQ